MHRQPEPPENCKCAVCDLERSHNETTIQHVHVCVCVCLKKGVMEWYSRCSLTDRSWPLWGTIFTQVLIFLYWSIFLTAEKFEAFCRVWMRFFCQTRTFNTGICTSNQEFSVAPEGSREFLSHMQLLWRGSLYRRNPSSCVKGLETGWLHGNSKLSVQYLKRWRSLLEII